MRFLVDECAGPKLANWLQTQGHDVFSIYHQARGMTDEDVLILAWTDQRVLITTDKDFGERIIRNREKHHGVVLLRLRDERAVNKILVFEKLMSRYSERLPDRFVVVTDKHIRFSRVAFNT